MKSTLSVPSAVIALLLAGDATAYHLGGSKPRTMRNGRRQDESVSPDITTVSEILTTELPTFTPSTGVPTSGGPLFPTGFNSTYPPFPTGTGVPFPPTTGLPFPPGSGAGDDTGNGNGDETGPTTTVDCSAMASSIFGSIFPYPTGGASGFPGWPSSFPTGGPFPSGAPTITLSFPPGPAPTGPPGPDPTSTVTTSISGSIQTDAPAATVKRRFPIGFGRPRAGPISIPSGVFPPGHAYPTGIFPTPTEEQKAQISHYFEVCGWGKGGKGKGKGKGTIEPQPVLEGEEPGCDKVMSD